MPQASNEFERQIRRTNRRLTTWLEPPPGRLSVQQPQGEMDVAGRDPPAAATGKTAQGRPPAESGQVQAVMRIGQAVRSRMLNRVNKKVNLQQEGYREDQLP